MKKLFASMALLAAVIAVGVVADGSPVYGADPPPLAQGHGGYEVQEDGTPEITEVGWSIYNNPTEGYDFKFEVSINGAPKTQYTVNLYMLTDTEENFTLIDSKLVTTSMGNPYGVATAYFTITGGFVAAEGWQAYADLVEGTKTWDAVDPFWIDKP